MAKNTRRPARVYPLGAFGLLLMLIVARLAPAACGRPATLAGRIRGGLARGALDGIAVVGWMVDHLIPVPRGSDDRRGVSREISEPASSC